MSKNPDPYGERAAAKRKGGRPQINSGRSWFSKGDYTAGQELFDRKETRHRSYSVDLSLWRTLYRQATQLGKNPALEICFLGSTPETNVTLVVLEESRYIELLEMERSAQAAATGASEPAVGLGGSTKKERLKSVFAVLKEESARRDD